jgi:hypothetical protein
MLFLIAVRAHEVRDSPLEFAVAFSRPAEQLAYVTLDLSSFVRRIPFAVSASLGGPRSRAIIKIKI